MRYSKFKLDVFILFLVRMEFGKEKNYFLRFKIIYFIYLLNKKKIC